MTLLAIDPGKYHVGAALFGVEKTLVSARKIVARSKNPAEAAKEIGRQVRAFAAGPVERLCCELPNVRARVRQKGDPNDLLYLMLVNGAVFASVDAQSRQLVEVTDWKGTTPKNIVIGRITGNWGNDPPLSPPRPRLETSELHLLGPDPDHNVVEAVGIGLWALKRL